MGLTSLIWRPASNQTLVEVRGFPTRNHPSRHTLTSLSLCLIRRGRCRLGSTGDLKFTAPYTIVAVEVTVSLTNTIRCLVGTVAFLTAQVGTSAEADPRMPLPERVTAAELIVVGQLHSFAGGKYAQC